MKSYAIALVMLLVAVGAFLTGAWYSRSAPTAATPARAVVPASYTVDGRLNVAPGRAHVDRPEASMTPGTVSIASDKQQLIGVRVGQVETGAHTSTRRLPGRVVADESRLYRVNVAMDSWVQEIFPVSVGSLVQKDQPLLSFYSPDFLGPMQAYFYALGALDRYLDSGRENAAQIVLTKASIQQAADTLKNLGMGDRQIEELGRTRQHTQRVRLTAPASGLVIARNASPGQRLERGAELYRIADLGQVWILVDIFEHEADYVRPGVVAKVWLPPRRKSVDAWVSDLLPQFDPVSRSLKMRLEAENPGYTLRPDMFVDVDLPLRLPAAVTVPIDAVLDSGLKKTVFVERGHGLFEPRAVETGWRSGDRVEIVRGLAAGDRIVISGTFLLDSESRMRLGRATQAAAPHEVGHGGHRQ
jgi:Cu(I)/Ag(I) efflux system membrane fusion protein